jgi:predicted nucleic acid-binding protein
VSTGRPLRLLLDANVVLDLLANRAPWAHEAALVLTAVEDGRAEAAVAAHTVTTLYYLLTKSLGRERAVAAIVDLTSIVAVIAVDRDVILEAIALGLRDLEDGVQAACALRYGADLLVTRNGRDFQGTGVAVAAPAEVLARL